MTKKSAIENTLLGLLILNVAAGCGGENDPTLPRGQNNEGESLNQVIAEDCIPFMEKSEITLNWEMPTLNTDGTPLVDLKGFQVYYGNESGFYNNMVEVGVNTNPTLYNLPSGRWYFAVKSFNQRGMFSEFSNEVCAVF